MGMSSTCCPNQHSKKGRIWLLGQETKWTQNSDGKGSKQLFFKISLK